MVMCSILGAINMRVKEILRKLIGNPQRWFLKGLRHGVECAAMVVCVVVTKKQDQSIHQVFHYATMRPTDGEMISIEKQFILCYIQRFQEKRHAVPLEKDPGLVRMQGEEGMWSGGFPVVKQGRVSKFRTGLLNDFSRLWGIQADLSCLVYGPR